MLLVNSKYLHIGSVNWTEKDLNRFLKLWMAGSNPSLELLVISFPQRAVILEENVYVGLGCQDVTENRFFKLAHERIYYKISDGKDITRRDGIRATIEFLNENDQSTFYLSVWHDHCVSQETDS